jgi:hypothetical protein
VQDHTEQGTVHFEVFVIGNESQFAELVHEEAYAGPGGSNDPGEGFLADLGDDGLGFSLLAEVGQQQEHARQAFFARVEQLVHQVFLNADTAGEQVLEEQLRKDGLFVEHANGGHFLQPREGAGGHGSAGRHALGLSGEATFAEEIAGAQHRDHRFPALCGDHGQFDLALANIKDRIRRIALGEDDFVRPVFGEGSSTTHFGQECLGAKCRFRCFPFGRSHG